MILLGNSQDKFTIVGTNIDEVKRQNADSGMTYNELNEWFAKKMEIESMTFKSTNPENKK
ncbi:hypothetical protein [Psychrobacillus sp. L3]|uniref:hypothetical protein n=1 Tax=Psychrobacillus sp. L3 TaxID=3236891 RepID=UPI0036F3B44B